MRDMKIDVQERQERAQELFLQGYNCCQSVVLAFADVIGELSPGITEDQLRALSSGFGGGFGRLREVCGSVSGMTILAGFLKPSDPEDRKAKTDNYGLVQKLAEEFRAQNGSIVCRDLLGLRKEAPKESPQPSERTEHYYGSRPCTRMVGSAARILATYLVEMPDFPNK